MQDDTHDTKEVLPYGTEAPRDVYQVRHRWSEGAARSDARAKRARVHDVRDASCIDLPSRV